MNQEGKEIATCGIWRVSRVSTPRQILVEYYDRCLLQNLFASPGMLIRQDAEPRVTSGCSAWFASSPWIVLLGNNWR